ncbi:MAG: hypothetical protein JRI56_00295 [Deltaproteobacteria bacterium]|nr:hypothetical protein [Deltaproteobacteria bacterium]
MSEKYEFNDNYSTSNVSSLYGDEWSSMSFTPSVSHYVQKVKLVLGKAGNPGDLTVSIRAVDGSGHPTGDDLASGVQLEADIPLSWDETQKFITFSSPAFLSAGTTYTIVARALSGDASNYVNWYKQTSDVYPGGNISYSEDGGSSWNISSFDAAFEEWGIVGPPHDRITIKKLVAAANNKIYYEDSSGSMVEISDSSGDFDTSEQTMIFEAFQKVVVVNGSNLKIADFINTCLDLGVGNELTSPPARGDVITQATSGASMIVDFVDPTKRYIYGYTTTDAAFETTAGYTLSSDDGTGTMDPNPAPAPEAVTEASSTPLWYDYTAYPDIVLSVDKFGQESGTTKSFGSLPAKAYLGCLYRGRVVLSGNPDYPHQWYMSRQANIWDWEYIANDAQTPVVGNNSDAGEVGDIIKALIPYKDDFLIFGCASSMWMLRGDPAAGGVLAEIDLTVGIFGHKSWCFDGDGNLYFWGTNGIYVIPAGTNSVKSLTENSLPNLIEDTGADPNTHRITMEYDRKRRGILICVTKLSDGTNSNYWYDLRTRGFFPETYPNECGVYSIFYYSPNSPDYEDLLLGCRDGYIRKFLDSAKDDDIGVSDTAINSYCVLPIIPMGSDGDYEGLLSSLTITTAGGNSGGEFGDTDSVNYELFSADAGEVVLENIIDGDTARESGTITGSGRSNRARKRIRGAYLGIKLSNSNSLETWAIDKVEGNIQQKGRIK